MLNRVDLLLDDAMTGLVALISFPLLLMLLPFVWVGRYVKRLQQEEKQ